MSAKGLPVSDRPGSKEQTPCGIFFLRLFSEGSVYIMANTLYLHFNQVAEIMKITENTEKGIWKLLIMGNIEF